MWTRIRLARSKLDEIATYELDWKLAKIATWENAGRKGETEFASLDFVHFLRNRGVGELGERMLKKKTSALPGFCLTNLGPNVAWLFWECLGAGA